MRLGRYEIYTSGATRNVSKDYSLQWRQTAKEYLEEKIDTKYDVNVFVPEMYFYRVLTGQLSTKKQA